MRRGSRRGSRTRCDSALLLEQRVERFPCVVGRLRLPPFVRGKVPDHLRLEERALVPGVLIGNAGRDVLPALPKGRRVEEAAIAAGVELRSAFDAELVECRLLQAEALLTALVALEDFGAEAPRR